MEHKDKYLTRRYGTPYRLREVTDVVYSGANDDPALLWQKMKDAETRLYPTNDKYTAYVGEIHGHSNLSDGSTDIDEYFTHIRDVAKLDFAVLSDHDHGGVGSPELWSGSPSKWDIIRQKTLEYREVGSFSTLLAYEKDAYPIYDNIIIYFKNDDAEMVRGAHDGEMTAEEFRALLARDDVIVCPHDTYYFMSGADLSTMPFDLITPFFQIVSRGNAAEYMGNPGIEEHCDMCEGGYWQDGLRRGAKICVIAGSDDHTPTNGCYVPRFGDAKCYPGVTGVWAIENTPNAIFDAIKSGRTFAYMMGKPEGAMRGRMEIEFRINGHWMGETVSRGDNDLQVYYRVSSDIPVKRATLVKNCRNYISLQAPEKIILDYRQETPTDCYYLRVELEDGRFGWSSPIWVEGEPFKE